LKLGLNAMGQQLSIKYLSRNSENNKVTSSILISFG
jgi:hypothetical protein